jgi:hypothetical protein
LQVILKTSNIRARIDVITPTTEGDSYVIIVTNHNVVDGRGSEVHHLDLKSKSLVAVFIGHCRSRCILDITHHRVCNGESHSHKTYGLHNLPHAGSLERNLQFQHDEHKCLGELQNYVEGSC